MTNESQALVPTSPASAHRSERSIATFGPRALAKVATTPTVRRAVLTGIAFGLGYQLSKMMRSNQLPRAVATARDMYQLALKEDPVAEGRLAGSWARRSMTIVAGVYSFIDRDDRAL